MMENEQAWNSVGNCTTTLALLKIDTKIAKLLLFRRDLR